jgi:hypothetical protein
VGDDAASVRDAYASLDGTLIPIDRVADQSRITPESTSDTA